MPTGINADQRQVLLNAGKTVQGMVSGVHHATGTSLERRGYGHYHWHSNRTFYLNQQGLAFVLAWEERNKLR